MKSIGRQMMIPIKTKYILHMICVLFLIHISMVRHFNLDAGSFSHAGYDVKSSYISNSNEVLINCGRNQKKAKAPKNTKKTKNNEEPKDGLVPIHKFYEKHSKCTHKFKETVTFFHLGKAGGGTVSRELRLNHMSISMSHPKPNPGRIVELQRGPSQTLIVNLRDPIDRFISAFRWRLVVLCSPDDERKAGRKGAAQDPFGKCKTSITMKAEEKMLRETYNSDPNVIAEALCEDNPKHAQAVEDYKKILHSMPLSEWLSFLVGSEKDKISSDGIKHVIALPMEKQQGNSDTHFTHHIQQLSLHLLETRYDRDTAKQILQQKPEVVEDEKAEKNKQKWEHSSANFYSNSTNTTDTVPPPPALSPLGECCLARHLTNDYRMIMTMLQEPNETDHGGVLKPLEDVHPALYDACSWGISKEQQELCRNDLKSVNDNASYSLL